jgi:hypothetical protein
VSESHTRRALAVLVIELLEQLAAERRRARPIREAYHAAVALLAERERELRTLRQRNQDLFEEFRRFRERLLRTERSAA